MKTLLLLLIIVVFNFTSFAQEQNIAAVVDEKTKQIDIVFISKIFVMLFIGVVALFSYLKFRKTES